MLKVVQENSESNDETTVAAGGSLLDEIVRDGARQMLAAALQAEVAAYIEAHADQVDDHGHRLVVRNGSHEPREVSTAAGAVPVQAPRVNDKRVDEVSGERVRFSSSILPAWSRKSPLGVVPQLRATLARYPTDPIVTDLVDELRAGSPDFERLWQRHDVAVPPTLTKTFRHTPVGAITLDCDALTLTDRDQHLVLYSAAPHTSDADALALLAVVGTEAISGYATST